VPLGVNAMTELLFDRRNLVVIEEGWSTTQRIAMITNSVQAVHTSLGFLVPRHEFTNAFMYVMAWLVFG